MARPWETLARAETDAGVLELRRRAIDDLLLLIDGRVLMSSRAHRSEVALAVRSCAAIADRTRPRVLIGGLGMGYTLRAALDALPRDASIVVAEVTPEVALWCRAEMAHLSGNALADPRVVLRIDDVARIVTEHADGREAFDAIIYDLYEGPSADTHPRSDPFYGDAAVSRVRDALRPGGVFAVWSEGVCPEFERRLRRRGFEVAFSRPGRGGLRHAVYLARRL